MADFPNVISDYGFRETTIYNTLISPFWGHETRRHKWGPRKQFSLIFSSINTSQMNLLRDFFVTKRGDYAKFTWEHPLTSTEYNVRFSDPEFKVAEIGEDAFDVNLELIEVL